MSKGSRPNRLRAAHTWLRHQLLRRFTATGRLTLAMLGLSAALGVDTQRNMAYQVFCAVLALFLGGLAGLRSRRPAISFHRQLPRFATAGEGVLYRITVTNTATRVLRAAEVGEMMTAELMPSAPNRITTLAAGQTVSVVLTLTPTRRGHLHLAGLSVVQPEPLGLLQAARNFYGSDSLLVLPRRYRIPVSDLPGRHSGMQGHQALPVSVAAAEEFQGLREYRPGDPLRLIHWKSWARCGKPVIREFQDECAVRHALILDTLSPSHPATDARLEEAISVAASFACTIDTRDNLLDLLFAGDRVYRETAGRGHGPAEHLLEVLAGIRPSTTDGFGPLQAAVSTHLAELSGCICILLDWDSSRLAFVDRLRSYGLPLAVFVILDASSALAPKIPLPEDVRGLRVGRIEEDLASW